VIEEAAILSDDVDTHLVDVPTDWRTIPSVPDALVASRRSPDRVRLVEYRLVADTPVVEALVILASVE
jgi:hypothetical protein